MVTLSMTLARKNDLVTISKILTDATKHKNKYQDRTWGDEAWSEQEVKGMMREGDTYLLRLGSETVGTLMLLWEDDQSWDDQPPVAGYLHKLAIKDGFHGQDLGSQAIELALSKVIEKNRSFLRLDCEESNQTLCQYYENHGFHKVGSKTFTSKSNYTAALYERAA
jgi:ribosomal protein S18 acetylase RimI-like enzyme